VTSSWSLIRQLFMKISPLGRTDEQTRRS